MNVYNVVKFRVKSGREQQFLDAHRNGNAAWPGLDHAVIIKTGDRDYCLVAKWGDQQALANARSGMIATLDRFRDALEEMGPGLGVTDAASGPAVLEF